MKEEFNQTLIRTYKGFYYYKDKQGLWTVLNDRGDIFIVALDDSKNCGRKIIVEDTNKEITCKEYIDFCTS